MTAVISERDTRDPLHRLPRLLDDESLTLLHDPDDVAATVARGRIAGEKVIAFCTDATVKGGALGLPECLRIRDAIELALAEGVPVIGLWHSGGAKLAGGVESMHGIGAIFASMVRASGRIPQLSVVLGPAAGGAAYGPALTDIVVQAPAGRIFITGPDVVRSVTGEQIDMAGLGGPDAHVRKSGVTHVPADSEEDAYHQTRRLVALLARPGAFDPARAGAPRDLRALLPDSPVRAYPVRPLLTALLDDGDLLELQPKWAPNMVVGLGRLGGGTIGVVANNPLRKGGCLDSVAAEKASRFVRMCDGFGVPLLVVVDVPGYLPGVAQEWGGVVRRGAKLLYAFAEATVPRVTLITRKSYGGAYIAMNSRALGATSVLAWPDAEVAVMGAEAAVGIIHRRTIAAAGETGRGELVARLVEEHRQVAGGLGRALDLGVVDEVVRPEDTRARLVSVFADAAGPVRRRGTHGNIPL
ncbi:carboxyl transferase domain-containing protein [Micromonospora echinofusca]|uniref:Acetyl-CoA/propionyl-CoA carboxylase carboxyl transferase subunit n=1 Tax=Micromonospora echinofusca TaxID=47858 RepID=A0A1C5GFZ7_MICEH|nr:carboxyl transferase domain-containing protein [Micromonospora echinofusca]SCG18036.1 acetyl-CoA/propionyl-CoA carboxylase carboxyl transferase subunit [Micromonospora echinofusca]